MNLELKLALLQERLQLAGPEGHGPATLPADHLRSHLTGTSRPGGDGEENLVGIHRPEVAHLAEVAIELGLKAGQRGAVVGTIVVHAVHQLECGHDTFVGVDQSQFELLPVRR